MSSWYTNGAHDLPEAMKFALRQTLDTYETIANMLHQEEKYRMSYLINFVSYLHHHYIFIFLGLDLNNYLSC
jgi:hypothetical protein